MAKPAVAIVLSGCGVYDGAEIHESVLTMLAIVRRGGAYQCFAPNIPQSHVINHLTGQEESGAHRNVLIEAARIARGDIRDLKEYKAADYDALVFPGGFGAAKNLCSFAFDGPECRVNRDVERVIKETHTAGKPIAALCISPVLLARVLGPVEVTIGDNADIAANIESMGGHHKTTTHGDVVVDRAARVVTTPCYMLDATIDQVAAGVENAMDALFDLLGASQP